MPIRTDLPQTLTPRERAELDWEKENTRLQIDYATRLQELELEVRKLEVKWTQVFKLPLAVLGLPIKLVMALAIPMSVITKKDLPERFWEMMK